MVSWGLLSWPCPLPAPCAPAASSLVGQQEKLKSPWLYVSTSPQHLKHRCVISIILILNPKHNTIPATRRKNNSIPAEARTLVTLLSLLPLPLFSQLDTLLRSGVTWGLLVHPQILQYFGGGDKIYHHCNTSQRFLTTVD